MASSTDQRERAMELVYARIDRARASWRTIAALDGLVRTFTVCGAALIAVLLADNVFHLPPGARLVGAATLAALLVAMLARRVTYPLFRRLTDEMVAAHVEHAFPELNNELINSVLLHGERFRDSLTRLMVESQLSHTAQTVRDRPLASRRDVEGLRRHVPWVSTVVGVLAVYALFFSGHMRNALARIVQPFSPIAPLTDTRLDVRPGDASVLQGDAVRIEARVSGLLPESARISMAMAEGERSSDAMTFEGNAFTYTLQNVQQDLAYRVEAGDALTPRYRITVRRRPAVSDLTVTYTYPAYTGLPERTETEATGDLRAPVGTIVRLAVRTDRAVPGGRIEMTPLGAFDGAAAASQTTPLIATDGGVLAGELIVKHSGRYSIVVEDEAGVANVPRVRHIEAVPDAAPRVRFVEPGEDVAVAAGAAVTLLATAEDDFSLQALHLFVQRSPGAEWEKVRSWQYEPATHLVREGAVLDTSRMGTPAGASLAYYAQANDGLRHEGERAGRSRVYHVRVLDPEAAAAASRDVREALADVVRRLIKLQGANLGATRDLSAWAGSQADLDESNGRPWREFGERTHTLVGAEEDIYKQAAEAARTYGTEDASRTAEALERVTSGPVADAVDLLKDLKAADRQEEIQTRAGAAEARQAQIVALLEQLLADPAAALASLAAEEEVGEELGERLDEIVSGNELAERLLKALDRFGEEQRRIIEMTNQLAEKPVDDFTDEDEKALQEIIDKEKEWTKFFQEAATDLSKLPPQDFSLASQAKEFLEIYSEVQVAAEEAERKAIELAVPHEQAGLELAESIETNIEKWLMEDKDNILWSMEEPLEDYDVPLVELPDELQDLIGDLVESEEDMLEEFDDVTSGWMDSLDIGAGWDTQDGPISNMSAKGVTGNRLPNTSEIGGRSGEGRTGKSSGQFVEEQAVGKGGRQTPSRLTPDPFEAGWVDDTSGESGTGATGGGKVSGMGAEGFQGPSPPPLQQELKRLAVQQQDLIDKARRLDYGLQKYRHPRGRLPESIELMQTVKTDLDRGEVSTFGSYQRIVLSNLRELKELTEKQKQLMRDRSALLPKKVREEIESGWDEDVPEQYREMVRNYFRALSEAGAQAE